MKANARDLKLATTDGYASSTASPTKRSPRKRSTSMPASKAAPSTTPTMRSSPMCVDVSDEEDGEHAAQDDPYWVPDFGLHESDRRLIQSGWLNDRIVDAVNRLLSEHLGFDAQSTLLSQTVGGFSAVTSETIMIIHAADHWVTVAVEGDDIWYMDSIRPHKPITDYVVRQLLQLFADRVDERGKLQIHIRPSTPQTNASDCGVFAAAYAVELAVGNPAGLQAAFDVKEMRPHLVECIAAKQLQRFPRTKKRGGYRRKVITVTVGEDGVEVVQ